MPGIDSMIVTGSCSINRLSAAIAVIALSFVIGACSSKPLLPYTEDAPPLVLMPASQAGIDDERGRFREIFCAVLEERQATLPDYRSCDEALTLVGKEPGGTGRDVELGDSQNSLIVAIVPGVGWSCMSEWMNMKDTEGAHIRQFGYEKVILQVDALSSSSRNARQIRDEIMAMGLDDTSPRLVLIGYSKGTPDILEAVVSYPEIRPYIAAVVSVAGAVGGSPLANDASQSQLELLRHWPDAQCTRGDSGALDSLRPTTRKNWLVQNPLPDDFPYYSLVTYPKPESISSILQSSYDKLSRVDARNDSQLMFYDQVIPGSTLLGYVNADHWAVAVPIARTHETIGSIFVDKNSYPREVLLEAVLRFVEEKLPASERVNQ